MRKVTFSVSMGLVGCNREETFTLEELGLTEGEDFDTEEELDDCLKDIFIDWQNEQIDGGWEVE